MRGAYFSSLRMFEDKQLGERRGKRDQVREKQFGVSLQAGDFLRLRAHKILPFSTPAHGSQLFSQEIYLFFLRLLLYTIFYSS
jgi:hypothetical protein